MVKFRRKNFKGLCPKCNRARKLRLVGEDEELGVVWLRCQSCLQTHSYATDQLRKSGRVLTEAEAQKRKEDMATVVDYAPDKTFWVGQKIRHPEFDEVGEVTKKERTAGKNQLIHVKFENQGTKKLVENFEAAA